MTRSGSVLISEDEERDKRRRWNPPRRATAGSANEQKRSFSSHTPGHDPTVIASASGPVPVPSYVSGNRDTSHRELTPGHGNILPFLHRTVFSRGMPKHSSVPVPTRPLPCKVDSRSRWRDRDADQSVVDAGQPETQQAPHNPTSSRCAIFSAPSNSSSNRSSGR